MSENAGDADFLESIIKIEPEEFETIEHQSSADVLKSNFPDLIEVSKLSNVKPTNIVLANSEEIRRGSVETLARKGNKGKRSRDPHICCFCQKVFSGRKAVKEHLERFHLKATQMSCDLCPKILFTRDAIVRHMRTIHGEEKFACGICNYKTAEIANLKSHKLIHAARTECLICKKQVTSLKSHMQYHQPKENCSVCQKAFMPKYLKRHLTEAHKILKCDDCQETFKSNEEFRRHKLRSHYERKIYECHCGSVYRTNRSLRAHQQSHSEEKETCDVCQKHFASTITLKVHREKLHGLLEEKCGVSVVLNTGGPFICDKCGSKYSSRRSIQSHILAHRSPTIYCDLCPRSFNQKGLFTRHMTRSHLKLRPFQCDICPHKAFFRCDLELHKLQHSSKTECRLCHKLVANVSEHLRTHIKAKCPVCGKKCSRNNLSRHLKTHSQTR